MKATDLIAALTESVARLGDCDVWVGSDLLMKPTAVEVWQEPYFDTPAVVIVASEANGPETNNVHYLPDRT